MIRRASIVLLWIVSCGVSQAQTTTPRAADQFGPATSATSSTAPRSPDAKPEEKNHFKFRSNEPKPLGDPYKDQRPMERPGSLPNSSDGRPPVQCAQTPMDPACR
jgi:hypothetical protein